MSKQKLEKKIKTKQMKCFANYFSANFFSHTFFFTALFPSILFSTLECGARAFLLSLLARAHPYVYMVCFDKRECLSQEFKNKQRAKKLYRQIVDYNFFTHSSFALSK